MARPPLRLIAAGAGLLLIGGLLIPNSVWTLPVVIIGAVMVAIGWLGGRLDGRLSLEWGRSGTQLEFRARIAPAPGRHSPVPHPSSRSHVHLLGPPAAPAEADTIDATAHTVELELAELEALIAAAENPGTWTAPVQTVQKLRRARSGSPSQPTG